MPLIENVLKSLAKSVLIPLGLTAVALATDAAIDKKMFGSGNTTLTISNEKMNEIMKIVILSKWLWKEWQNNIRIFLTESK